MYLGCFQWGGLGSSRDPYCSQVQVQLGHRRGLRQATL